MKRVRPQTILIVLSMMLLGSPIVFHILASNQPSTGRVIGRVYDPNDAVFTGVDVIITDGKTEYHLKTSSEGIYKAELPEGIYRVTVKGRGLLPFRRAAFRIAAGKSVMINIAPAISSIPTSILYIGPPEKAPHFPPDKPLTYDSFPIKNVDTPKLELLVEYKQKKSEKQILQYGRATVSYDAFLLSADQVELDEKEMTVDLIGNVLVEDGTKRGRFERATFRIVNGEPKVEYAKQH
jgi:hypothetical protein